MVNVIAAVAQMEKALLIERVNAGLERAKSDGKKLGRPSKTTDEQKAEIRSLSVQGFSVSELAKQFKISRASVLNVLQH